MTMTHSRTLALTGVAMGAGGSAMASEAADIVIMSDNIRRLPDTLLLCKQGRTIIIQNCVLAIAIKLIGRYQCYVMEIFMIL